MLTHIQIRNLAIVEHMEISLTSGMTVLTGETGAGKSILLDALHLAMGGRGDTGLIRHDQDRAEISAAFDIHRLPNVIRWLNEYDLDDGTDCLIRRTINMDGRSKGYINGYPVPMQSLRDLGERLVDIHGQHEHQSLLKPPLQRQALDDYAGHESLLSKINASYKQWKKLSDERHKLLQSKEERSSRIDLLSYQTNELAELGLDQRDIENIEIEFARLANLNQLQEGVEGVLYSLTEDENVSIIRSINRVYTKLEELQGVDDQLTAATKMLNDISIQTQEVTNDLRAYLSDLTLDPQRLDWLNERLALLHDLSRKHKVPPKQLPELYERLSAELELLLASNNQFKNLDDEIAKIADAYYERAAKLTLSRHNAAKRLTLKTITNIQQLGMKDGQFAVEFTSSNEIAADGLETINYMVSMNSGQPMMRLSKVASGGELSRISLALQVIIADTARIPTLIFDEVDVGIGGGTAEIVGRLLSDLGDQCQVICVTHQPQVAALAKHHLCVTKKNSKDATQTYIEVLDKDKKTDEIARMLGGVEITKNTLNHAQEMIEKSQLEAEVANN
jgi:DNA repair protein RecN (Recombination protein N)